MGPSAAFPVFVQKFMPKILRSAIVGLNSYRAFEQGVNSVLFLKVVAELNRGLILYSVAAYRGP